MPVDPTADHDALTAARRTARERLDALAADLRGVLGLAG